MYLARFRVEPCFEPLPRGSLRTWRSFGLSAARIFAVFCALIGGTPVKRNGANLRTISASFDVLAGERRTSTANRVSWDGVCDADAKVGTAAQMFAVFGRMSAGTPGKRNSANAPTKVAYLDVLAGDCPQEYDKPRQPGRSSGRRNKSRKRRSDLRRFWRSKWRPSGETKEHRFAHEFGTFRRDGLRPSLEYGKPRLPGQGFGTLMRKWEAPLRSSPFSAP
ncbi:hypothetical protein MRX96_013247 [Rhipicephalus microplus]